VTGVAPHLVRRDLVVAVLGVVLVALSMRAAIGVIGPLYAMIAGDLALDVVVLAFIGAAPPLGFALAGLLVPPLTRRVGLESALLLALVLLIAGQGLRAASGEAVGLVASTFLAVLGIGATNVLLPPLVRRWFPGRIAGVTSGYLILLAVSAAVPAFVGVQIAEAFGWRPALAVWILLPALALLPWWALRRAGRALGDDAEVVAEFGVPVAPRPVSVSPTAWALVAVLVLPSISTYTAAAILPAILVETAGLSAAEAGAAMGVVYLFGVPLALLVPLLARRRGTILPLIVVAGTFNLVAWVGILVAPGAAPFLWATLLGLVPITFPLALLLLNLRSRAVRTTVALSGFVQGLSYFLAGAFALGVVLLHDATDSWTATVVLLAATSVVVVPGIVVLARGRFVDDELGARHR
jgi:CP family cyanate transporter-like MFS transporter